MQININGEEKDVSEESTISSLLEEVLQVSTPQGAAVAINDRVVPRSMWKVTKLCPEDQVVIVSAAQGG